MPATKGIRDSAARYAPTPPRMETQMNNATAGPRPVQPTRSALLEMACMMPSRLLTLGSATSTATVQNVSCGDDETGGNQRARNGAPRVFDLIAHEGRRLRAGEGIEKRRPHAKIPHAQRGL